MAEDVKAHITGVMFQVVAGPGTRVAAGPFGRGRRQDTGHHGGQAGDDMDHEQHVAILPMQPAAR